MSNQSSTLEIKREIQKIIGSIELKSADGGYIYRGEPKIHTERPYCGKVTSSLWREYGFEDENFDIEVVQREMLVAAKKHIGQLSQDFRLDLSASPKLTRDGIDETVDFEILTEIQHYGGKTNLIDFTTDYFIALFFACDGAPNKDGRVILQKIKDGKVILQNTKEIPDRIEYPRNPRHRVIAQKSVFVRPSQGFIEPDKDKIITIPANLKKHLLQHLRNYHGIYTEVIYNDLYGFIRHQGIHGNAYTQFYKGFACHIRGNRADTSEDKQKEYEQAIEYYTKAIELNPDLPETYNNRAAAYFHTDKFDNAINDANAAITLKPDFPEAYNVRGVVYNAKREFDNAIRDYTTAIRIAHNFAEAYAGRSFSYASTGQIDQAIKDANTAIALKPDLPEAYNARGAAYATKREFDNAIIDYTTAIEIAPNFVEAYAGRGFAYVDKREFDNAIKDYNMAIQLKPDHALVYCNRGEAWLHIKEWENATKDLTTAKNMGHDIIGSFHNDYNSVADFNEKNEIEMPETIAAMLTKQ